MQTNPQKKEREVASMKKNDGITMISLMVTVLILMIISSIAINLSFDAYHMVKVQNFIAKMSVIQGKVDQIAEEKNDVNQKGFRKLNASVASDHIFLKILQDPTAYNIDTNKSWNQELDSNPDNYYYFTPDDLDKKLGLKDQDMNIIINFKTRNVISSKGVKIHGEIYFRQYDLEGGDTLQ